MTSNRHSSVSLVGLVVPLALLASSLMADAADRADPFAAGVHVVRPGPNVQFDLQSRLIAAVPGDVIQLEKGTFTFDGQLDVTCDNVTLRGRGPGETVLSFKGQAVGSSGIVATGDGFVIEDLAVEDTAGNAIKVLGANGVVFRRVRAEWTRGPHSENGAYGLYPVQCENVLIEDCTAIGASDAGIYVGQSKHVVVRRCRAERNVAGIEIENTLHADVYENVATANTGGLLVFDLPGLQVTNGGHVRLFRNEVRDNNTPNFAPEGNIVGEVPPGTGLMIMATDNVEAFDNDLGGNQNSNVAIVSYLVTGRPVKDPKYDPYPEGIHLHGNRYKAGGTKPGGKIGTLLATVIPKPFPDILYDGIVDAGKHVDGKLPAELGLRISDEATFANFDAPRLTPTNILTGRHRVRTDLEPHAGRLKPIAAVELAPFPEPRENGNPAVAVYRSAPPRLSGWKLFEGNGRTQQPVAGVLPYELNTPLFSDHTSKHRFIRLPQGTAMTYRPTDVLAFPTGTVIAKTFALPTAGDDPERLLETRIQVKRDTGWYGFSYLWNADQTDADLTLGGASIDVTFSHDGERYENRYRVPNANQCITCHSRAGTFTPLGPTGRNLNRPAAARRGGHDQLKTWHEAGWLREVPAAAERPRLARFDDPTTGSLEQRARAWLEVNCAHCHSPEGTARTTGLDLRASQTDPAKYGVLKSPVAAGRASGGRKYDIAPGEPDESILLYRMESNEPGVRMPNLSRNLPHDASIELIREWIARMPKPPAE